MNSVTQQALQLRDIHLPAAPGFWPPAPGWWVVGTLLVLLAAGGAFMAWRRHRARWRVARVLRSLSEFDARFRVERSTASLARISMLMRQIALARFPREQVSPLTGRDWLRFLDESGGKGGFADGPGRVLASVPYQRTLPADLEPDALMALVHDWVEMNVGRTA